MSSITGFQEVKIPSKCRIVVTFLVSGLQIWLLGAGRCGMIFFPAHRLGGQNVELSSLFSFQVSKTCNCRHFWGSKRLGCCQSVELSSLCGFWAPNLAPWSGPLRDVFFFSGPSSGWSKRRTVVTLRVSGVQNV